MLKRICAISSVLLIFLYISTSICFAAGLNVLDNFPKEGSTNSYPINLGIKLYFDGNVAAYELREQNEQCLSFVGEDGAVPIEILYADSDPTYMLVMTEPADQTYGLGSNKVYTLSISDEFSALGGATLSKPFALTFKTRNTSGDMTISMLLMGLMFAGMIIFTMISSKRQAQKTAEKGTTTEKVNPYKKAKETGKSVQEIIAEEEKKRKKLEAKAESAQAPVKKAAPNTPKTKPKGRDRIMRVSRPHPISEAGSTYKSGRKAAAEKRAKELEEQRKKGTTRPKNVKPGKKKKK